MTFYLSNDDVHPVGVEPGEFLELPEMDEARSRPPIAHGRADRSTAATARVASRQPTVRGRRVRWAPSTLAPWVDDVAQEQDRA